jgi:hypothetical protein
MTRLSSPRKPSARRTPGCRHDTDTHARHMQRGRRQRRSETVTHHSGITTRCNRGSGRRRRGLPRMHASPPAADVRGHDAATAAAAHDSPSQPSRHQRLPSPVSPVEGRRHRQRRHTRRHHQRQQRQHTLTAAAAVPGAVVAGAVVAVGRVCDSSSSAGEPRQHHCQRPHQHSARKASHATTASTHTAADTHHIRLDKTVGAQGITSRDSIRSSQPSRPPTAQPHNARGHDSAGGSSRDHQPRQHPFVAAITGTTIARRCRHLPAREQERGQSASRTTTHRQALIAAASQQQGHAPHEAVL